ncbi:MAG: acyl-CoA dehydratase activase [Desulfovibrionales bacterium]
MHALGICIGASTIGMVLLRKDGERPTVVRGQTKAHDGDPRSTLTAMLKGVDGLENMRIAATGRKFRHLLTLPTISEPEALEAALGHILPEEHPYRTVISAGGETFMVYHLDDQGRVQAVHTGNKCASGTGEFLLQQLDRMGLGLEEMEGLDTDAAIHQVSGRCSVFCKSDCTHALNKGVPKRSVVAGLTRMMAGKCFELIKKLPKDHVVLIGGCSRNRFMVHYLKEQIPDLFVPEEGLWFEALGAGIWALEHEATGNFPGLEGIFRHKRASFSSLQPLSGFREMVEFKSPVRSEASAGDEVILGLDVGSTTTKGVLMRVHDEMIVAADYLRTEGDPVGASRRVYSSLDAQVKVPIRITGLGVTGSGRAIAGLHARTDGVINEIVAHAAAAVHFDPQVDTIFEIGGQDAKYTYITNSVPSDYAMNEACSAGTGSFLEESAKETLGIQVTDIGRIAIQGGRPPNFNDQCAAFISSDIKIATQEGLPLEDILAGLVYSICMNYSNRVKGNRPVGEKVFMQGGVCYNEAVPAAMAALTGKRIVVPPEPGLMGALGVALEVKRRQEQHVLEPGRFDLKELATREVEYLSSFRCKGGKEQCDRRCEIARIKVGEKVFPFGGICNRYENLAKKQSIDQATFNLVSRREKLVFQSVQAREGQGRDARPTVGMTRSFLMNTYFPLFATFFEQCGFRVVLPDKVEQSGMDQQNAPFCFPGELAHGFMAEMLRFDPDFIFLPHLRTLPKMDSAINSFTCVLVQGEAYYLRSCFKELDDPKRLLSPVLNFEEGVAGAMQPFLDLGKTLGRSKKEVVQAFQAGVQAQEEFFASLKEIGRNWLQELEDDPESIGIVLFGRPYSAFTDVANKGVPVKFASRGVRIIPFDMLPFEDEDLDTDQNMYWGMGQMLLRAARMVKKHPRLFGTYVTNFSCGPDSFLVGYFRDIMGKKPSLTLELDSHTADAGLETRVEAFLDIIEFYRKAGIQDTPRAEHCFTPARLEGFKEKAGVRTSSGEWLPLNHDRVKLVFPALNYWGTQLLAKSLSCGGIRAEALLPADEEILKIGRGNSSCKECLPLQLTVGSMLEYLERRDEGEVTVYFMPSAGGPCRFGQYNVFSRKVIERREIEDAAVFSTSSLDGYGGLGNQLTLRAWRAVIVGDLLEEMQSTVLAGACDPEEGMAVLEAEFNRILEVIAQDWKTLRRQLENSAHRLSTIPLKRPVAEIPKISLVGEIYVRHDPISRQGLVSRLAQRGFIVRTSQVSEWLKYTDWLIRTKREGTRDLGFWVRYGVKMYFDRIIREKLAPSGLFHNHTPTVKEIIESGAPYISRELGGEAILTVGAAFHEILNPACGVISLGPFGCMPSRLAQAVLSEKFTTAALNHAHNGSKKPFSGEERRLPFLAVETDGNPFPQVIEAQLEAFCLQAQRTHEELMAQE